MPGPESRRYTILGLLLVGVSLTLAALVVAAYAKAFTPTVSIEIRADRSGLLTEQGAAVAMHGVTVGEVRDVHPDADGRHAVLEVALEQAYVTHIPANVLADIVAPTLLAAKYVELRSPPEPSRARIADGARIDTTSVSTEINTALQSLNTLLSGIDVAKLNSALGSLSTALQGKGGQTGELLRELNADVRQLNPSAPTLAGDLAVAADVTDAYSSATPDLVRTLDGVAVTSATLVDEQRRNALSPLLYRATNVSDDGRVLLEHGGGPLRDAMETLRPTAALLADYAPMLPCVFASVNQLRGDLENAIGGQYPGVHTFTSFLPGQQSYVYPRDLPVIAAKSPPSCFGGPLKPQDAPFPYVLFPDGWHGFVRSDGVSLRPGSPLPDPLPRPLPRVAQPGPGDRLPGDQSLADRSLGDRSLGTPAPTRGSR